MDVQHRLEESETAVRAAKTEFAQDVLSGLSARHKTLPPKYFYDDQGTVLFEKITTLPEYYIPKVESSLLSMWATNIATYAQGELSLVELGCGTCVKTRHLIEALLIRQGQLDFYAVDISPEALRVSEESLRRIYARLNVHPIVGDYDAGLKAIQAQSTNQKMVLFLGSSLGNFHEEEALNFLAEIRRTLNDNDFLLLGVDMVKDKQVLEDAYNDPEGVTAAFNLNVLRRINRELEGEFDTTLFRHVAFYNGDYRRIEMHLKSQVVQDVPIKALGRSFHFEPWETIRTECSYKFTFPQLAEMSALTGYSLVNLWQDAKGYFTLVLLRPSDELGVYNLV